MTNYPFWSITNTGVKLGKTKLCKFLIEQGFGNYTKSTDRTANTFTIRTVDGYVQFHSPKTIKKFLIDYVSDDPTMDDQEDEREKVLDELIGLHPKSIENYLTSLVTYSSKDHEELVSLDILLDDKETCYIPFKNGVVRVTKNSIDLLPKDALEEEGKIWETSVRDHSIVLDGEDDVSTNYLKDFITYAMKKGVEPKRKGNDISKGTESEEFKRSIDAFETAFGYMLHSYIDPANSKVVMFIDSNASSGKAQGGNGKSLAMKAISYFKKTIEIEGKNFQNSGQAVRFNFSKVTPDTKFVCISDAEDDFNLKKIFNLVTDKFQVEGKGTNSWDFDDDDKPKIGITTNHIVGGTDSSYRRRMVPVEFGDFWSRGVSFDITPSDIFGLTFFKDFSERDWNTFYTYGFHCIQRYLKEGLILQDSTDLNLKLRIKDIEGKDGDGVLVKWIKDWIDTERVQGDYHKNGISVNVLWKLFAKDFPSHASNEWTKDNFGNALYRYVTDVPELDYNPHLASKGKSKTDRRWRMGGRGNQEEWVKITHIDDIKSDNDVDDDALSYFQDLAA